MYNARDKLKKGKIKMSEVKLLALCGERGEGLFTKVNAERYEYLSQFRWHLSGKKPRIRRSCNATEAKANNNKFYLVALHREIMGFPEGLVDHKDGDIFNNTDENLRLATPVQNGRNRHKKNPNKKSKYIGVSQDSNHKKWTASIRYEGRTIHIGSFGSELEAALARDGAVKVLFQEFGNLNLPDMESTPFVLKDVKINTSQYRGVYQDRKGRWKATIKTPDGKEESLLYHKLEIDAARIYDGASIHYYGEGAFRNLPDVEPIPYGFSRKTSKYRGVSLVTKTGMWSATVWYNKKARCLGVYSTEEEARLVVEDFKNNPK